VGHRHRFQLEALIRLVEPEEAARAAAAITRVLPYIGFMIADADVLTEAKTV
jgi:hypothetical protein